MKLDLEHTQARAGGLRAYTNESTSHGDKIRSISAGNTPVRPSSSFPQQPVCRNRNSYGNTYNIRNTGDGNGDGNGDGMSSLTTPGSIAAASSTTALPSPYSPEDAVGFTAAYPFGSFAQGM